MTITEAFKEAGNSTGYIVKYHLVKTDESQLQIQGFDYTAGVNRAGQPVCFFFSFNKHPSSRSVPDLPNYKKR